MSPSKVLQIVYKYKETTTAMNGLTSALTMNKAMKTATTTNVSKEETLLENQNGWKSKWKIKMDQNWARKWKWLQYSYENSATEWWWNDPQDHERVNDDSKTTNPEDNQPA